MGQARFQIKPRLARLRNYLKIAEELEDAMGVGLRDEKWLERRVAELDAACAFLASFNAAAGNKEHEQYVPLEEPDAPEH